MPAFAFPRGKHTRRESPPKYADYQKYRPHLQREFARVCVYCCQPDTITRDFSVDHYRPKSLFPALSADYKNLFYCCSQCNRYKGAYWPTTTSSPFIPNPCDHVMWAHLRVVDGSAVAQSEHGAYAIKRLNLNEPIVVRLRRVGLGLIRKSRDQLESIDRKLKRLAKLKRSGAVSEDEYDAAATLLTTDRAECVDELATLTGEGL